MIVRACTRIGLALALAASSGASGCASDRDEGVTTPPERPDLSRAQIYDRDRTLVAGVATSLALGIVGLGTMLASGIWAAPGSTDPHPAPPAVLIAGGAMSLGFITAIPFAIAVERHRHRYPEYFPHARGRTRVAPATTPPPSLQAAPPLAPRGGLSSRPFAPGLASRPFAPGLASRPFAPGLASRPFAPGLASRPFAPGLSSRPFAPGPSSRPAM
jgi:hypothetical protein